MLHQRIFLVAIVISGGIASVCAVPLQIPTATPAPARRALEERKKPKASDKKESASSTEVITTSLWPLDKGFFKKAKDWKFPAVDKPRFELNLEKALVFETESEVGRGSSKSTVDYKYEIVNKEKKFKHVLQDADRKDEVECKLKNDAWECLLVQEMSKTTISEEITTKASLKQQEIKITDGANEPETTEEPTSTRDWSSVGGGPSTQTMR